MGWTEQTFLPPWEREITPEIEALWEAIAERDDASFDTVKAEAMRPYWRTPLETADTIESIRHLMPETLTDHEVSICVFKIHETGCCWWQEPCAPDLEELVCEIAKRSGLTEHVVKVRIGIRHE